MSKRSSIFSFSAEPLLSDYLRKWSYDIKRSQL